MSHSFWKNYFNVSTSIQRHVLEIVILFFIDSMSFKDLQAVSSHLVDSSQTGELSAQLNLQLDVIQVEEPEPVPVDPTGGVRATNNTGKLIIGLEEYRSDIPNNDFFMLIYVINP